MTVGELQRELMEGRWTVVRQQDMVRTFVDDGSCQLLTLAGDDADAIPDATLNDIRWMVSAV